MLFQRRGSFGIISAVVLPILFAACGNPWSQVKTPTATPPESIGSFASGCLRGGIELEKTDDNLEVMRLSRHRYYGHPLLIGYIRDLAAKVSAAGFGRLLVGDLAQPRGGPTLSTHVSHQTGLEADIWFLQLPAGRPMTMEQREIVNSPDLVMPDFGDLNGHWNPKEIQVLYFAASDDQVDRIFVNPVIKKAVCKVHPGEAWVGRLRPWWDHDDHFHVRLKCAAQDVHCSVGAEDPLPPGDGCDVTLDAWFSPESKAKAKQLREHPKPSKMPHLPPECKAVLKE